MSSCLGADLVRVLFAQGSRAPIGLIGPEDALGICESKSWPGSMNDEESLRVHVSPESTRCLGEDIVLVRTSQVASPTIGPETALGSVIGKTSPITAR
jgi:hypothetical protein